MKKEELSHEVLKTALDYDPETGLFTWNYDRPVSHFKNEAAKNAYLGRFANKPAGHIYHNETHDYSYLQIRLFGDLYMGHRLAWFYCHGEWPEIIDHIDGNGLNNKISNLRDVGSVLNGRNCKLSKNNKSGVNGVWWHNQNNNWVAEGHYTENGVNKKKSLGSYKDLNDAKAARKAWEESVGGFTERHGTA